MRRQDIKDGTLVIDRWFSEWGIGLIESVKKTVFTVKYPGQSIKYDYAHAQFLEKSLQEVAMEGS